MNLEELIEREDEGFSQKNEEIEQKDVKKSSKSAKKPTKLQMEASLLSNAKSEAEGIVSVETEGYFRDEDGNFLKNLEQVLNDAMIP